MKNTILLFIIAVLALSCKTTEKSKRLPSEGDLIISRAIQAHGGANFNPSHFRFSFRGAEYSFHHNGDRYRYSRRSEKNGVTTFDEMTNDSFSRTVDSVRQEIKTEDLARYRNSSINSVIYFALLPYKLDDAAVRKEHLGETRINLKTYQVVRVTFAEEGGGKDHEDTFMYWIGADGHIVDFLAYNYKVNGGGVRFRAAYNPRIIDGIRFQDYVNYKAPIGTPLTDLPALYEAGQLEELSKIELVNIRSVLEE